MMGRLFHRNGDRGASSYVEFLIIVVPFIAILFVMFEMANISNTRMSMARGVQEGLIKASMSPLDMDDPGRWEDLGSYVISQGNARAQYDRVEFVESEGAFDSATPDPGEVIVLVEADSDAAAGTPVIATPQAYVVSLGRQEPPTIRVRAKYGYRYVTGFINLLYSSVGRTPPSTPMVSEMVSVNEHPDYERH